MTTREQELAKFVILAQARTGSNMLVSLLDQHPQVRCLGEAFNPDAGFGYEKWVRKSHVRRIADKYVRDYSVTTYLDALLGTSPTDGLKAVGFKVIYPGQFDRWQGFRCYWRTHDFKVISLIRNNLLSKYVSARIADAEDQWSAREHRGGAMRVNVDVSEFKRYLERVETIYRLMETLTIEFRGVRVSYEDLCSDRENNMGAICRFLGVDEAGTATLRPSTVKQNPATLQELVENYDEVCSALRNTQYERFLE